MARHGISFVVVALIAGLGASPSLAEPGSNLGGGFLELLITGRDPTPRPWLAQPAVSPARMAAPVAQARRPAAVMARPAASSAPAALQNAAVAPRTAEMAPSEPFDSKFARQEVAYAGPHEAGVIVVDTPHRFLFLVLGNGRALRYGIGVGRPGFEWAGVRTVSRKAQWPDWTPPPEMLKRRPELPVHMAGGIDNPLGARALYLGSSLYRIHGTNEP